MTQIKFFFNVENKIELLCSILPERLIKKKNSLIYCASNEQLKNLSSCLWSNDSYNFFPHEVNNHHDLNKITLSNENIYWMDDTLINISNTLIDGFNRYLSLFEMVSVEEEDKKLARIRFQYYKDRGYSIESINVKKN